MTKEKEQKVEEKLTAASLRALSVGEELVVSIANLPKLSTYKSVYGRSLGRKFSSCVDAAEGIIVILREE